MDYCKYYTHYGSCVDTGGAGSANTP